MKSDGQSLTWAFILKTECGLTSCACVSVPLSYLIGCHYIFCSWFKHLPLHPSWLQSSPETVTSFVSSHCDGDAMTSKTDMVSALLRETWYFWNACCMSRAFHTQLHYFSQQLHEVDVVNPFLQVRNCQRGCHLSQATQ